MIIISSSADASRVCQCVIRGSLLRLRPLSARYSSKVIQRSRKADSMYAHYWLRARIFKSMHLSYIHMSIPFRGQPVWTNFAKLFTFDSKSRTNTSDVVKPYTLAINAMALVHVDLDVITKYLALI